MAIRAAKRGRGRPSAVLVILALVTAVASAGLDNVTTVLLIPRVTFLVCERLPVPAAPFLIAEALAANIGGTAMLAGDPPNVVIASRGGLSCNDFLVHLAPRTTSCRTIGQFWRVSAGGCAARSFGRAGLPVPHGSPDSFGPNPATVAEFPGPTVLS